MCVDDPAACVRGVIFAHGPREEREESLLLRLTLSVVFFGFAPAFPPHQPFAPPPFYDRHGVRPADGEWLVPNGGRRSAAVCSRAADCDSSPLSAAAGARSAAMPPVGRQATPTHRHAKLCMCAGCGIVGAAGPGRATAAGRGGARHAMIGLRPRLPFFFLRSPRRPPSLLPSLTIHRSAGSLSPSTTPC